MERSQTCSVCSLIINNRTTVDETKNHRMKNRRQFIIYLSTVHVTVNKKNGVRHKSQPNPPHSNTNPYNTKSSILDIFMFKHADLIVMRLIFISFENRRHWNTTAHKNVNEQIERNDIETISTQSSNSKNHF